MKKIVLMAFLLFSMLGFSRFIEECRILEAGPRYAVCESLSTGKRFSFASGGYLVEDYVGSVFKIYFEGTGYRNLHMDAAYFLYN